MKVQKEASASISAIKKEYQKKQAQLEKHINEVTAREKTAQEMIAQEVSRIDDLAEQKIADYKDQKNALYRCKVSALYTMTVFGVLYSVLFSILTAAKSPRFLGDILSAVSFIGGFITGLWKNACSLASAAWSLHETISYDVINVIIPGALAGLGFAAMFGGILGGLGFLIYRIIKFYADHFADSISLLVALVTFAILVCFADYLTFISWNLLLLYLIIHAAYIIIRILVSKCSKKHLFS